MEFLHSFVFLFWEVVLPILVLASFGYFLHRRFALEVTTLAKMQLYIFTPGFMFVRVSESQLAWRDVGLVMLAMLAAEILLAVPLWFFLRHRRIEPRVASVLVLTSVVFNSGNYGVPLAERAFGAPGGAVQALILMTANISIWVLGYLLMSAAHGGVGPAMLGFFRTPMPYALAGGLIVKATGWTLPPPAKFPLDAVAAGLVPVALITLGAQLALRARKPRWRRVGPVIALKLLVLPGAMAGVVWAFGLWPWPGAMLIVAASAPTAINVLLLAIELDGDTDLAADAVFWTTITSLFTVTLVLTLVKLAGGGPP